MFSGHGVSCSLFWGDLSPCASEPRFWVCPGGAGPASGLSISALLACLLVSLRERQLPADCLCSEQLVLFGQKLVVMGPFLPFTWLLWYGFPASPPICELCWSLGRFGFGSFFPGNPISRGLVHWPGLQAVDNQVAAVWEDPQSWQCTLPSHPRPHFPLCPSQQPSFREGSIGRY